MASKLVPPILRSSRDIAAFLERSGQGLTHAEAQVLSHLATTGSCSIGDLHRLFGQKRSTLTSVLDRLTAKGFITRELRRDDRRSFNVSLTTRGKAPAAQLRGAVEQLEETVLKRVRPGHLVGFQVLIAAVERVLALTESEGAEET